MAVSQSVFDMTFVAGANLASSQYRFVTLDAAANTVKVCGTSDRPLGVLQNKPAAADDVARVRMIGISKVKCGAALNESDFIASNGEGFGTATTLDTAYYVGRVLVATGGSGELGEIMVNPGKYPG